MTDKLRRLHSLDLVRGLAAFAVVFNHWKHFQYNVPPLREVDRRDSPLYDLLRPLYENGWIAVDLFFAISGFIFAYYYLRPISDHALGAREFFVKRVSRLYPLLLLTTLIVASFQFLSLATYGHGIVYANSDAYHLALSLLFMSAWGIEAGPSFNGPSWSISIEMLLYALFFLAARSLGDRRARMIVLVIAIFAGTLVQLSISSYLGRGVVSFFLGWIVVDCLGILRARISSWMWILALLGGWGVAFFEGYTGNLTTIAELLCSFLVDSDTAAAVGIWCIRFLMIFVLFPLSIAALAILEERGLFDWAGRAGAIGDISYSVYLLHFPLQCAVILGARVVGLRPDYYNDPLFMVGFVVVLVGLSHLSTHRFEKPMQRLMRKALIAQGPR